MNCWQLLKIPPTDDKRVIKRAYAQQLKAVRPDVDPEGFQQLHQAYQTALQLGESRLLVNAVEPALAEPVEIEDIAYPSLAQSLDWQKYAQVNLWFAEDAQANQEVVLNTAQVVEHSAEIEQANELLRQVEQLLLNGQAKNDFQQWQFLLQSPVLLDDQAFALLQIAVAQNLGQDIQHKRKNRAHIKLDRQLLLKLNAYFSWDVDEELRKSIGAELYDDLIDALEDRLSLTNDLKYTNVSTSVHEAERKVDKISREDLSPAFLTDRFMAFFFDIWLVYIVVVSQLASILNIEVEQPVISTFVLYGVYSAICSVIPKLKGTVGQYLFKLTTRDQYANPLTLRQSSLRALLISGYFVLYACVLKVDVGFGLSVVLVSVLNAVPVAIVVWKLVKKTTLHDLLTKTAVYKKNS
ncbi:RDD family protein [Pseudomonas sp. F1_0610]|uniref:RDD family protein n=1 Tax=Pseudomonas sp. F1_0610 TaxID=3114284 RepID=UPI0039C11091